MHGFLNRLCIGYIYSPFKIKGLLAFLKKLFGIFCIDTNKIVLIAQLPFSTSSHSNSHQYFYFQVQTTFHSSAHTCSLLGLAQVAPTWTGLYKLILHTSWGLRVRFTRCLPSLKLAWSFIHSCAQKKLAQNLNLDVTKLLSISCQI